MTSRGLIRKINTAKSDLARDKEIGSSLVSLFGWRRLVMWAKTNGTEGARFKSCRDLP